MANRFVRSSKYRHVFGTAAKKDSCYDSIRITKNPNDSSMCSVNKKFMAVVLEGQGGGAFLVCPLSRVGRFDINFPKVSGHKNPVLDIAWNPFNDNEIASSSEDATIMLWDIPDEGVSSDLSAKDARLTLQGHQRKVTMISWHPSASDVLMSVASDPALFIWNTQTGEKLFSIQNDHPDLIYSASWSYDGHFIATTCKDKKIRVFDARKGEKVSEGNSHAGTKPSRVIFCGTTNKLFTTGFTRQSERQYALWNPLDLNKPLTMTNIDVSSGVLFPVWDEGTKMVYIAGKGDTTIKYFEVTEEPPYVFFLTMYQHTPSQRSVAVMAKKDVNYMKCEVMRFFKVIPGSGSNGYVEPISMTVPRKSDMFQDDIYPPCPAGEAAMTADEWVGGANKAPLLLKFTPSELVKMSEADSQAVYSPMMKKTGEKAPPSVHKRLGSPQPGDPSARPTPVSLAEYKDAYKELLEENAKLKKRIAELEK